MSSAGTTRTFSPLRNMTALPAPAAIPTSASLASPGPLTSQPITATFMFLLFFFSNASTSLASFTTSTSALPQLGHATKVVPLLRRFNDFNISYPAVTSSVESPLSDTLMVSPIPSYNKMPSPTAVLIEPDCTVPASVIPK